MTALLLSCGMIATAQEEKEKEKAAAPITIVDLKRDKPVDFSGEILPVFRKNCLACHNKTDAKGELVLETPETILKGGETGPAVLPGKSKESLLLQVAARQTKPFMPPRNNKVDAVPLTPEELGLLKLWIDQGATGAVSVALGPVQWRGFPANYLPIGAVAITADGQYAACGRGNELYLYDLDTGEVAARLADPELAGDPAFTGAADRDLINSLAFTPDGKTLAAGGYRSVKLWQRQPLLAAREIKLSLQNIADAALSEDGAFIAFASDNTIELVSTQNDSRRTLTASNRVARLAFGPENRLAAVAENKGVQIWLHDKTELLGEIPFTNSIAALAWLGTGSIATAGGDNAIRIWKIPAEKEGNWPTAPLKELAGHAKPVTALAALAEGQLISGSADGTIRLWDVANGKQIAELSHGAPVSALTLRADRKRAVSTAPGVPAKLWNLEKKELLAELKGDPDLQLTVDKAEQTTQFARNEKNFYQSQVEAAQKLQKAEAEALKKATEAKAAADKNYADKEVVVKKAEDEKKVADRNQTDADAALKNAVANRDLAQNLVKLAQAQEKAAQAVKAQIEQAFQKAEAEKNAIYAASVEASAEAKTASQKAGEAKAAASAKPDSKELAEAKTAAEKTAADKQKAAESALDRAASVKVAYDQSLAARNAALSALEQTTAMIKEATNHATQAEKPVADYTARKKEAEEKVKATEKSLADATAELKKLGAARDLAAQTFQTTQGVSKKADEETAKAQASLGQADADVKKAEAALEDVKKSAAQFAKAALSAIFSADNKLLLVMGEDGVARTWDSDSGKLLRRLESIPAQSRLLQAKNAAALTLATNAAAFWPLAPAWSLVKRLGSGDDQSPLLDRVMALDFSNDGKLLATGGGVPSRSGEMKIWNVAEGKIAVDFKDPHSDAVFALAFSPDQKLLASGASDKFMKVFDASTGKLVRAFEGHTHHVLGVSWKMDGRHLASAGADKVIKVWDFASGEQRKTISGFNKEVTAIHFIGPSNEALAACGDAQVKIVREDGNNVRSFSGASDYIQAASLTPNGKIVIAGGQDGTLYIWNGQTGESIRKLAPPAKTAAQVAKQ